jgi:hypothetical protein
MLFIDRRRRGCGKCGKAGAFFAEAFPSSLWKSSRRSRRRPPLSISSAAAFSTALAPADVFGSGGEETDISEWERFVENSKPSSNGSSSFYPALKFNGLGPLGQIVCCAIILPTLRLGYLEIPPGPMYSALKVSVPDFWKCTIAWNGT